MHNTDVANVVESPRQGINPAEWIPMEPSDCENCAIRSVALFGEIDPQTVAQLQDQAQEFREPAGTVLYQEGGSADSAFTLREGIIKLVRNQPGGREQIVRLLVGGDFFGAEGLFGDAHHHSAIALTPVFLCRLPNPLLEQLRTADPTFTNALLNRWRRALNEVETLALDLGARKAEERVASFLLHWQTKHGCQAEWLPLPLSRSELGDLLGLRVETVSRVMARWKRERVFEERGGHVRLLDADELHQLVESARST